MLPWRLIKHAVWPVSHSCFQQEAPATAGGREQGAGEATLGECSVIPAPHRNCSSRSRHAGVLRASGKRLSPVILIPIRRSSSRKMKGRQSGKGNRWKKPTWVPPSWNLSSLFPSFCPLTFWRRPLTVTLTCCLICVTVNGSFLLRCFPQKPIITHLNFLS